MNLFVLLHALDGDTSVGSLLFNVDRSLRRRLGDTRGGVEMPSQRTQRGTSVHTTPCRGARAVHGELAHHGKTDEATQEALGVLLLVVTRA